MPLSVITFILKSVKVSCLVEEFINTYKQHRVLIRLRLLCPIKGGT
jgi:hypothetical protein